MQQGVCHMVQSAKTMAPHPCDKRTLQYRVYSRKENQHAKSRLGITSSFEYRTVWLPE